MDRISELPDFIVHHILSFINTPAELVRMSVLSTKWFDLTTSFPILDFTQVCPGPRKNYFKYVEYTISRFCHQNVPAHTFIIYTNLVEPAEVDIVNRCLELVLNKGVRELDINLNASVSALPKYRLPNVLLSVSVLKSLTISSCDLPSSFMVDVIRFRSLIQLTLRYISIDDEGIKHLTTSCPLLQEMKLRGCDGFKRFCVYGHQNLQYVLIDYDHQVERIDIEAPNLSTLRVLCGDEKGAPKMNLASCKKLTTVCYYGYPSTNSIGFTDFVSNFPFVETMFLDTEYKGNNLKLSSHSLQTLVLHSICDLEVIEVNAPNLVVFDYCYIHNDCSLWPQLRDHLKACMRCYLGFDIIDAIWFQKLRLFLDKKSGFKVKNLFIYAARRRWLTPSENFIELEKLKAIGLQPYELEHVELQLDTRKKSVDHVAFVDALLWCCRPKSLTISFSSWLKPYVHVPPDFEVPSDFVKFTYEKLLEQEHEGNTNIQIVLPFSTPLMALHPGEKAIAFIKEEGTG